MKFLLVVLILCFCLDLISAFSWFNFRSNEQPKQVTNSPSTYRQGSTRQQNLLRNTTTSVQRQTTIVANKNNANRSNPQSVVNQKQYDFRNRIAANRQANVNNKESTQMILQNRSQGLANQQQYRSFDSPVVVRQSNRTIKKTTNPRVRLSLSTRKNNIIVTPFAGRRILNQVSVSKSTAATKSNGSLILRNNDQSIRAVLTKAIMNSTKAGLLRSLTTKATANKGIQTRQSPVADFNYRQRLRAFDQYKTGNNTGQTYSSRQTVVRRQKRQNDQDKGRSEIFFNSMVYVRDAPLNDRSLN